MAIDTENKRRSAFNALLVVVYPLADGTIGAQDREQVLHMYSGITVGSAPTVMPGIDIPLWAAVIEEEEDY